MTGKLISGKEFGFDGRKREQRLRNFSHRNSLDRFSSSRERSSAVPNEKVITPAKELELRSTNEIFLEPIMEGIAPLKLFPEKSIKDSFGWFTRVSALISYIWKDLK